MSSCFINNNVACCQNKFLHNNVYNVYSVLIRGYSLNRAIRQWCNEIQSTKPAYCLTTYKLREIDFSGSYLNFFLRCCRLRLAPRGGGGALLGPGAPGRGRAPSGEFCLLRRRRRRRRLVTRVAAVVVVDGRSEPPSPNGLKVLHLPWVQLQPLLIRKIDVMKLGNISKQLKIA